MVRELAGLAGLWGHADQSRFPACNQCSIVQDQRCTTHPFASALLKTSVDRSAFFRAVPRGLPQWTRRFGEGSTGHCSFHFVHLDLWIQADGDGCQHRKGILLVASSYHLEWHYMNPEYIWFVIMLICSNWPNQYLGNYKHGTDMYRLIQPTNWLHRQTLMITHTHSI